jgi:hypothetical protein
MTHSHDTHGEHSHDHDGDHTHNHSDLEKLAIMLPHMLKHNEEHARDMKARAETTEKNGASEVATELLSVVELSDEICVHIKKAIALLSE